MVQTLFGPQEKKNGSFDRLKTAVASGLPGWSKDLLKAIGAVVLVALGALVFRPPKLDAIVKANNPKLYVPLLSLASVILVAIIFRANRKR